MIRALEHFTRVLFTGGESDLCAQFLYANLLSNSLGAGPFPRQLSEEELNDLLCGEQLHRLIPVDILCKISYYGSLPRLVIIVNRINVAAVVWNTCLYKNHRSSRVSKRVHAFDLQ